MGRLVLKVLRFLRIGALKVKSLANSGSERQLSGSSSLKPGSGAEVDPFRALKDPVRRQKTVCRGSDGFVLHQPWRQWRKDRKKTREEEVGRRFRTNTSVFFFTVFQEGGKKWSRKLKHVRIVTQHFG